MKNKVGYVKVCIESEDKEYTIKINGSTVIDGDGWTKNVSLAEGKNVVAVKIKNDENER